MSNTPIVVSVLALVLVGMLFGFNIQVSSSFIETIGSVGGTLSGLGAAVAAFYSYKSTKQWKKEFNHSEMYEHLNEIERLLNFYHVRLINELREQEIPHAINAFGIITESEKKTQEEYIKIWIKTSRICNKTQESNLNKIELTNIQKELFKEYRNYLSALSDYYRELGCMSQPSENKEKEKKHTSLLMDVMNKKHQMLMHTDSTFIEKRKVISRLLKELSRN